MVGYKDSRPSYANPTLKYNIHCQINVSTGGVIVFETSGYLCSSDYGSSSVAVLYSGIAMRWLRCSKVYGRGYADTLIFFDIPRMYVYIESYLLV